MIAVPVAVDHVANRARAKRCHSRGDPLRVPREIVVDHQAAIRSVKDQHVAAAAVQEGEAGRDLLDGDWGGRRRRGLGQGRERCESQRNGEKIAHAVPFQAQTGPLSWP